MVELVAVLLLVGVLAAVVVPKMDVALALRGTAWRDQVLAALRLAASTAHSHRRLVCVDIASGSVTLRLATANPATACNQAVPGPDGGANFASATNAPASGPLAAAVSATGCPPAPGLSPDPRAGHAAASQGTYRTPCCPHWATARIWATPDLAP